MRRISRIALVVLAVGGAAAVQPPQVPPDTRIQLERTRCFGACPVYSVTIDANGNVTFDGKEFVLVKGNQADRISVSKVRALLDTAERIGFFDLRDEYRTIRNPDGSEAVVMDLPTTYVTVTTSGRSKRIEDYFGTPKALKEFEKEIDEAAGTKRWTGK